jgi:hypothetical protein
MADSNYIDIDKLPRIPVTRKPTIWNRNMGAWGTAFGLLGIIAFPFLAAAFAPFSLAPLALTAGATAIGGLIGGVRQKQEMEVEQQIGKKVQEPTFFNSKIFSNALAVSFPASLIMLGAMASLGLSESVVAGMSESALQSTIGKLGLISLAASLTGIVSVVAGIIGGFSYKAEMQKDLDQAISIQREQELVQSLRPQMAHAPQRHFSHEMSQQPTLMANPYVRSVNAEEMQMLNARMKTNDQPRSFAQEISARRQPAEMQQEQSAQLQQ